MTQVIANKGIRMKTIEIRWVTAFFSIPSHGFPPNQKEVKSTDLGFYFWAIPSKMISPNGVAEAARSCGHVWFRPVLPVGGADIHRKALPLRLS